MPPKGTQSDAIRWKRCRHPASTTWWCRPFSIAPLPTRRSANFVAPDWLNRLAARKRITMLLIRHRLLQHLDFRLRHSALDTRFPQLGDVLIRA